MSRAYSKGAVAILLMIAFGIGPGCSKAKSKFKVPDIQMITSEYVLAGDTTDGNGIWVTGNFGIIFHSGDGGENWTEQQSGTENLLTDLDFVDSKTGWISGIKGTMLHTSDAGATWEQQNPGTKRHLLALSFVDKDYGWAIGEYTTILHTSDGGKSWVRQSEEQDRILSGVHFSDRDNGWVVGEEGIILHTTNGGTTWQRNMPTFFERENIEDEYENPRPALFGVYFTDKKNGWVCGMDSMIMYTANAGESWKIVNTGQDILYNIVVKGGRGWAVGAMGTYILSKDGGISWELQEDSIKSKLGFANLFFSSPQNGWVVGQSGTMVFTTDGGDTWTFRSGLSYETDWFEMPEALEKTIIE